MSKLVDIVTTATIRPGLLNVTLNSFCTHMLTDKKRYRLVINVDPIGRDGVKVGKVLKVAKNYFNDIVYNFPKSPSFTKAVIWCWQNTKADYVFHLEDDWRLVRKVNIDDMISILDRFQSLVSLRLNKFRTPRSKTGKLYGFVYHKKLSLNPTLFKGKFVRDVSKLMTCDQNPEKQLRVGKGKHPKGKYLKDLTHGIYSKSSRRRIVVDIGRLWMQNSKYTKKTGFMQWEIKRK